MKRDSFGKDDLGKVFYSLPTGNNISRGIPLSSQISSFKVVSFGTKKYVNCMFTHNSSTSQHSVRLEKVPVGNSFTFKEDTINSGYMVFSSKEACETFLERKRMLSLLGTELSYINHENVEVPLEIITPLFDFIKNYRETQNK